jgi:hypothetical protein
VAFLPFQLGFWMDRERNTHFVVTAVMNATANGGLGHPFFRPGAEIFRWNTNDIQSGLSRQALERLPVPWGETKMTHWVGPATVVPLRFCLPPDDPAATFHYNGRACDNKDASERCRRLNTGHHDFRRRMASCTSHGGHVWSARSLWGETVRVFSGF